MRSPIVLTALCAGLLVLSGCEQGTDLASDPVPVEVTAPEMDPEMAATASAEAEAARQQRATRTVGLAGTLVAPDLPALEIGGISALFDAQPADDGLLVRASATVDVTSRDDGNSDEGGHSDEDGVEGADYPRPAAAIVPVWAAGSLVCDAAEADEALADAVAPLGEAGCHGVVPALGVSGDPASGAPLSLGAVEANPDVSGESPLPVDAEAGDADELTAALARPDGWALLTPLQVETPAATHVYEDAQCALVDSALAAPPAAETPDDAIGSATILSTVELPDCA